MNVYRIGTNWNGSCDLLEEFKKNKIAFIGGEDCEKIKQVNPGDLVAITCGKKIKAIGKVKSNDSTLEQYSSVVSELELDVNPSEIPVLEFDELFFDDEVGIDFGEYGGQGRKFYKAGEDYEKIIIDNFNEIKKK